ncbi:MAG: right-handed parallel beta-helix repeat-containing protein, partial [Sedimentisphaerales bacterium]
IALDSNGHVWHWGSRSSTINYPEKVKEPNDSVLSNIVGIATCDHSVAVDSNGFVWEWYNSNSAYKVAGGQMGTTYLQNIAEVSAGYGESTARTRDGFVLVWEVGQSPEYVTDGQMQTQSGLLEGIISINRGYFDFELAIDADGRGWGWGYNGYGQLGIGDTTSRTEPTLMSCAAVSDSNGIIYVDKDATDGNNDGSSWDNAYLDFNDALPEAEIYAQALGECEIWVAGNPQPYKPPYQWTNYSQATFRMRAGNIAIRGHFGGKGVYETNPDQRDFNNDANETIFDGRVGPSGQRANYLVTCNNIGDGLVLDGFTFTGAASAGLYINNYSDPSIIRCKFNGNTSYGIYAYLFSNPDIYDSNFLENGYAGIYSDTSAWPYVKNCVFDGNNHSYYGLYGTSSPMLIEDCVIKRQSYNDSNPCDGIYSINSHITVYRCRIEDNKTDGINCSGGDVTISDCTVQGNGNNGIETSGLPVVTITNNKIFDNTHNGIYTYNCQDIVIKNNWIYLNGDSGYDSGLYFGYSISPPFVRNNTVVGNVPYGVYVAQGRDPCLITDIIRQNSTNIFSERGLEGIEASYNCIEGGFQGTGNIDCDPCFVNANANDYHLKLDSLCIDAGDPYADYGDEKDIDGQCRVIFGKSGELVDIGGDEYAPKADYNGDSIVNFTDFSILASKWRMTDPNISLDGNNIVDIYDLKLFCNDWLWYAPCSELYQSFTSQLQMNIIEQPGVTEEPADYSSGIVEKPIDDEQQSMLLEEEQTPQIWLTCDGNMNPEYGDEVTVYVHSEPALLCMVLMAEVDGDANVTAAMSTADCNNYGWDNGWNTDPVIDPDGGWVEISGVSWNRVPTGNVGYFKFRYYGGEVTVYITDSYDAYDSNLEPVAFSLDPLVFGSDPNQ